MWLHERKKKDLIMNFVTTLVTAEMAYIPCEKNVPKRAKDLG